MNDKIIIKGARENNLKNIDLEIPKNKLVVMTGVSGSGKSSLAFDTIYAEGERRYIESLSAYARQFLGGGERANVDSIEGLSPSISMHVSILSPEYSIPGRLMPKLFSAFSKSKISFNDAYFFHPP